MESKSLRRGGAKPGQSSSRNPSDSQSKFSFVLITNPDSTRTAETRRFIRKHVMQDIAGARRLSNTYGKRNLLQLPPSVLPSPPEKDGSGQPYFSSQGTAEGNSFSNVSKDDSSGLMTYPFYPSRICRLGAGPLDPFMKYPIKMDPCSKRLLRNKIENTTPTNKFHGAPVFDQTLVCSSRIYREVWYPLSVGDPAAFHQVLSNFCLHLDYKQKMDGTYEKEGSIAHHALAVTSMTSRLSDPVFQISDGAIGTVIGFACRAHRVEDFERWHVHMNGLREIIRLRGGVDSLRSNEPLRLMLFFVDVIGCCAQDIPPFFPIPPGTWEHSLSLSPHSSTTQILTALSTTLHHFCSTTATTFPDSTALTYLSPLIHSLLPLSNPYTTTNTPSQILEHTRLSSLLTLAPLRRNSGIFPVVTRFQVAKLKKVLLESRESNWGEGEFKVLRLWGAVVGGLECEDSDGDGDGEKEEGQREWFVEEVKGMLARLGDGEKIQMVREVEALIWIDGHVREELDKLWKDIGMQCLSID
ncbi:MAG: hypothetical protein M1834_000519 [Cirrosporium novae-zelandiae]|nr:MAG: hypothetical protein M1834_000519 [Cirrosporium novae-zelandiae]